MDTQHHEVVPSGDITLVMDKHADGISLDFDGEYYHGPALPKYLSSSYEHEKDLSTAPTRAASKITYERLGKRCPLCQELSAEIIGASPPKRETCEQVAPQDPPKDRANVSAPESCQYIEYKVSSRHLRLACPYFERMLGNDWLESRSLRSGEFNRISVTNCDTHAFLIVLHIIHGQTRKVPRTVSLDLLSEIAIIVNYYECFEPVEIFLPYWLENLDQKATGLCSFHLIRWLCISWIFRLPDIFRNVAECLIVDGKDSLHHLHLPISKRVIDAIDDRRVVAISHIFRILSDLRDGLEGNAFPCSFECNSALLGALMKEMAFRGLFPKPNAPFPGIVLRNIFYSVLNTRSAVWPHYGGVPCQLQNYLRPALEDMPPFPDGLSLDNFPLNNLNPETHPKLEAKH